MLMAELRPVKLNCLRQIIHDFVHVCVGAVRIFSIDISF